MSEVQTKCPIALPIVEEFNKHVETVKTELERNYGDTPNLARRHLALWQKLERRLVGVYDMLPEGEEAFALHIDKVLEDAAPIHHAMIKVVESTNPHNARVSRRV